MEKSTDKIGWSAKWRIDKFQDPTDTIALQLQRGLPIETAKARYGEAFLCSEEINANLALNEGLGELIDLICGLGAPTKWDNSNARLGVGDSNTAEAAAQTGLQATTNKTYKAMDETWPQRSNQTAEWRATFGSSEANFSWQEYTVVNAADDTGKNLNRKVSDKGTKSSGETWTLSLQITFS
jgi:ssRNA-specific RNase YbeY (16S rRNA maturation enzyme)